MRIQVPVTWHGHRWMYLIRFLLLMLSLMIIPMDNINNNLIGWALLIAVFVINLKYLFPLTDTLSTWLYIHHVLEIWVDIKFAHRHSWMFVPNSSGKWYPLNNLQDYAVSERFEALKTYIEKIEQDKYNM